MRILSPGHVLFAAMLIAFGIAGLVEGHCTALWQPVPDALPGGALLPDLCSLVALGGGLGLLWPRSATPAAALLTLVLGAWWLIFCGPLIVRAPLVEVSYQNAGETAVLLSAAWVLWTALERRPHAGALRFITGPLGLRAARVLYGLALIAFGLSHFAYLELTAPLVPAWLPGPVGWAYFSGAAYLAGGLAILTRICAGLAAALMTLEMALLTLLVWVPLAIAHRLSDFQQGEFALSAALTTATWVVADSYRGRPAPAGG